MMRSPLAAGVRAVFLAALAAATLVPPLGALHPALACSCVAPPEPPQALVEADAVFRGSVVSIAAADEQTLAVDVRVAESWKGIATERVTVRTVNNGAGCGFGFAQGSDYLVYASRSGGEHLAVSLCSRTAPLAEAAGDLAALGPGTPPQVGPGGTPGATPGPSPSAVAATPTPAGRVLNEPRPFPWKTGAAAIALAVAVLALGGALIAWRMAPGPGGDE